MIDLRLHNCKHRHTHAQITLLVYTIDIKVHLIFFTQNLRKRKEWTFYISGLPLHVLS